MTVEKRNDATMADTHTVMCILAETLLKHGVSTIRVSSEYVCDLAFRHATVVVKKDDQSEHYIIELRSRKHTVEYAEYVIEAEPKALPQPQRLLPP